MATVKPNEITFWHPANVTQTLRQPGVLDENRFEATNFYKTKNRVIQIMINAAIVVNLVIYKLLMS